MTDPNHPGWALWEARRREHRARRERLLLRNEKAGLAPPPPYKPLPADPGQEHLDLLVRHEAEDLERAKVFEYAVVTWTKLGTTQILARRNVRGGWETVLFDVPSGRWIWDPVSGSETNVQAVFDEDPYIQLEPATREEAEAAARRKGTTLPTPERLLEICQNQEGRELGMSATRADRENRGRS